VRLLILIAARCRAAPYFVCTDPCGNNYSDFGYKLVWFMIDRSILYTKQHKTFSYHYAIPATGINNYTSASFAPVNPPSSSACSWLSKTLWSSECIHGLSSCCLEHGDCSRGSGYRCSGGRRTLGSTAKYHGRSPNTYSTARHIKTKYNQNPYHLGSYTTCSIILLPV